MARVPVCAVAGAALRVDDVEMAPSDKGDAAEHQGSHGPLPQSEPPGWVDGAPASGRDQSCALCAGQVVTWVHPLAVHLVQYRAFGKGHTLPGFWTLCERREQLYASGDDEAVVEVMKASDGWFWQTEEEVDELVRQPLAVFRRADTGARRLVD
jgi:hypothetical protein